MCVCAVHVIEQSDFDTVDFFLEDEICLRQFHWKTKTNHSFYWFYFSIAHMKLATFDWNKLNFFCRIFEEHANVRTSLISNGDWRRFQSIFEIPVLSSYSWHFSIYFLLVKIQIYDDSWWPSQFVKYYVLRLSLGDYFHTWIIKIS